MSKWEINAEEQRIKSLEWDRSKNPNNQRLVDSYNRDIEASRRRLDDLYARQRQDELIKEMKKENEKSSSVSSYDRVFGNNETNETARKEFWDIELPDYYEEPKPLTKEEIEAQNKACLEGLRRLRAEGMKI